MKLFTDETGQDLVEYALIFALIALLTVCAASKTGDKVWAVMNDAATSI